MLNNHKYRKLERMKSQLVEFAKDEGLDIILYVGDVQFVDVEGVILTQSKRNLINKMCRWSQENEKVHAFFMGLSHRLKKVV